MDGVAGVLVSRNTLWSRSLRNWKCYALQQTLQRSSSALVKNCPKSLEQAAELNNNFIALNGIDNHSAHLEQQQKFPQVPSRFLQNSQ